MAIHNTPEERQMLKVIEKLSVSDSERQGWVDQIRATGMSEELAEQIQKALATPADGETTNTVRALASVEFSKLVRRWRMAQGAKKFR